MHLSCTVFELQRVICQKLGNFNLPHLHFAPPLEMTPLELEMYRISAPASAGSASTHFWQIWPNLASARILAGFVAAVWSVSHI